ncbi:nucleotidyltransferase family protein [Cohnella hashimotonis]|uniref:Nucleotidyltransferase family protein n=1 Tax=Cohnella hashimotonis TaxID=2826895 RepID=A0ABT6TUY0_9BACL|nr:nucleotidyltransferase family protein [Cohnella hashimotonis]MDI4650356.1 nucleotidyltransferase family protein [Cohnella hashimotonis]
MTSWKSTIVPFNMPIAEVIKTIDSSAMQIALVIYEDGRLAGTVTDGDVRRGILRGVGLHEEVSNIMNANPTLLPEQTEPGVILSMMRIKQIRQIPLVNHEGQVTDLKHFDDLVRPTRKSNWVMLMAGGLGTRLSPLTDSIPKPLLKVGGKPLLETILESFIASGFEKFYLSVNYKSEMVESYFGDGSKWGVTIRYVRESKRMGTAGALGLLETIPSEPMIVMNGDLLTKVNFNQLLEFHHEHRALATMCVRNYEYQVPYGVVNVDKHKLIGLVEKPSQHYFVNAGIYVLNPEVIKQIPSDIFYDMTTLFESLMDNKRETCVFPLREYWLDIGRMDDYERANGEYAEIFV